MADKIMTGAEIVADEEAKMNFQAEIIANYQTIVLKKRIAALEEDMKRMERAMQAVVFSQ